MIFKFTFDPPDDYGFVWGPDGSTIAEAYAIVGLKPITVAVVKTAEGREPDAEMAPGWRFG